MSNEIEVVKNKVGRPLKFNNAAELDQRIKDYFDSCIKEMPVRDKEGNLVLDKYGEVVLEERMIHPFTITGLCFALNCEVETIKNYSYKDEFSESIKHAYKLCQNFAEEQMYTAKNPAGAIFALKNYGWSDKQEIDHTVTQKTITVTMLGDIDDD